MNESVGLAAIVSEKGLLGKEAQPIMAHKLRISVWRSRALAYNEEDPKFKPPIHYELRCVTLGKPPTLTVL